LVGFQFDEIYFSAFISEDVGALFDEDAVRVVIDGPDEGEDQARQIAGGDLFEYAAAELGDEIFELRVAEVEEVQHELEGHVVMEKPEGRKLCKLVANGHFANGGRAEYYYKFH